MAVQTMRERDPMFLRKATGLVKGWSTFDAFLYSFMSVNLVTLGFVRAHQCSAFVPNGELMRGPHPLRALHRVPGDHVRRR